MQSLTCCAAAALVKSFRRNLSGMPAAFLVQLEDIMKLTTFFVLR